MGFEGEFASYEPLRRMVSSDKLDAMKNRFVLRKEQQNKDSFNQQLTLISELTPSDFQPDLVLAIDGGELTVRVENGFPGAEVGYITVASVLIDLQKIKELGKQEFINPIKFRETEKASTIDSVFPGCNVILDNETSAKASLRKALFESLKNHVIFEGGESLLDTYEALLRIKIEHEKGGTRPKSPLDDFDENSEERLEYGFGEYKCKKTGKPLYSTDALRLHELMNPSGSNGEMFGQIRSTLEKLWLMHILRAFEKREGWLPTLRRVAFVMDGPLAVFSTSSWLTKVIEIEIERINNLQKKVNKVDLLIIGIEKSGTFVNHLEDIDTSPEGIKGNLPIQAAFLLGDDYIKKNIIYSDSSKPYGVDTYFARKFFYKTKSGQLLVPNVAYLRTFEDGVKKLAYLKSIFSSDFPRLADVMSILDNLVSSRYPNSVMPLISAHAEASIPLNLGTRIFEEIAREIKEKSA